MCGVAPAPLDEEAEKFAEALLALSEKPAISPAAAQGDGEPDDGRFYCPFPGCKRSFAELWRLKVHYRCEWCLCGAATASQTGSERIGVS